MGEKRKERKKQKEKEAREVRERERERSVVDSTASENGFRDFLSTVLPL